MVTDLDITRELRKLAVVYTHPPSSEDELVRLWRHVLEGVDAVTLSRAVSQYVRSDARYWPKPGQILAICREITPASLGPSPSTQRDDEGVECGICGAVLEEQEHPDYPGTNPRLLLVHDYDAHATAGQPINGPYRKRAHAGPGRTA